MRCKYVQDNLPFYAHNELPAALHAAIAAHLTRCPQCRTALQRSQEIDTLVMEALNAGDGNYAMQPAHRTVPSGRSLPRLLRHGAVMAVLMLTLLFTAGGVVAAVYTVVLEQSQWHNTLAAAAHHVPFPLFTTAAARVESVQILDETPWTVVHMQYVLPDGQRFSVTQQPVFPQQHGWEGVTVLDPDVPIGDGGVLYLAVYAAPAGHQARELPALAWHVDGVDVHLKLDPGSSLTADEVVSLAHTFSRSTQTP